MSIRNLALAAVLAVAIAAGAAPAGAQVRSLLPASRQKAADSVPRAYLPPPGMCRIWLDNVPPAQQPAPTDCPAAIRRKPQNARVIFGEVDRRRTQPAPKDSTGPKKPEASR